MASSPSPPPPPPVAATVALPAAAPPAAVKVNFEERMLKIKEAKAWKELMAEEKEHMMMPKKDMDEDQLMWWNDTKVDIMERKRQLRGESSTLRGESPMSGCGDGGVDNSTSA
jgi:hypothetical protein